MVEVLHYMERAFSDETALDNVPLEAAGNPGAWKAWRAYRINTAGSMLNEAPQADGAQSDEWNWDGVWEERVQKGIDTTTSDSILFGGPTNSPELVCLLSI